MTAIPQRPVTMVIGALGGEGGGVLASWVAGAAELCRFPTQLTSIPGVAQRTGATTYYIEIYPVSRDTLDGRTPVMALYPAPNDMDVVVASELMEAGRMLENGLVTPERTTLIASTHRVYSISEKSAMSDALFRTENLTNAAHKCARRAILFDMAELAAEQGTVLNAILLGVIAGSDALPIPATTFAASVRQTGVAVEANLRGFELGLACMRGERPQPAAPAVKRRSPQPALADLLSGIARDFPAETGTILAEGLKRLTDYQDPAYASLYLERMREVLEHDRQSGGGGECWALTIETGRYLALMMSYEDIIRVADLKSRASRMQRLRTEVGADPAQPVRVTEFLKPGFEEFTSVMPPWLGRRVMVWARRNRWARGFNLAMRVRTDTIFGFLRLWLLARLRVWRRRTYRYAEEQAAIEDWLQTVKAASGRHYGLALEIAELANLRKGYSDTHRRGVANFTRLMGEIAIPCTRDRADPSWGAIALARAREAALADPDGNALDQSLNEFRATRPTAVAMPEH